MERIAFFPSVIGHTVIDKNTDQLKSNTVFHSSNNNYLEDEIRDYHCLDRFPRIKKIILNEFLKFIQELGYDDNFKISTSWFTIVESGEEGHFHNHKNCFYSGIYYYDEYDEDSATVSFESPNIHQSGLYVIPKENNSYNAHSVEFAPKKNLLIFFPNYLQHKVNKHRGNVSRHSLAFNFIPTKTFGIGDSTVDFS